jgi:repressor LexA
VKKRSLHPTQQRLIEVLLNNIDDPLTIREIKDEIGASSTSVVAHHISQLEKKGHLKRNPLNPRDYHVVAKSPERQIIYLNLYGLAQCGPRGSFLDGNPIDRLAIPSRLVSFPAEEAFLVQAKGDSMAPRINHRDLVIARRNNDVESGRVVVCVNDGEALIKKLVKERNRYILYSTNPKHPPFLAANNFKIVGEIKAIISHTVQ